MIPFLLVIIAIVAYGLGALNGAMLLSRFVFHKDLRRYGSRKASYANFVRAFGGKWGVALIVVDVLKSSIGVLFGGLLMLIPGQGFPIIGRLFAGLWLVMGQMYPVQYQFRGAKGVVPCLTTLWLTDWRVGLIASAVFIIVLAFSQYVSLAGMCACFMGALATWVFVPSEDLKGLAGALAMFAALLIVWRHRGNIIRIQRNREPRVKWGRQPNRRIKEDDF